MSVDRKCYTCTWWESTGTATDSREEPNSHGECAMVAWADCGEVDDRTYHPESLAHAGARGSAWLDTSPLFGCVQWSPRE